MMKEELRQQQESEALAEKSKVEFGKRLKSCRESGDFSMDKVISILGLAKSSISNYENAKVEAKLSSIVKLAAYFNVSTDYILGLTDTKSRNPNIQSACDYTHLTDKAAEHLHNSLTDPNHPLYRDILSYLIESGAIERLVLLLEHSLIAGKQYELLYEADREQQDSLLDTQEFKFNQQLEKMYIDVMKVLEEKLNNKILSIVGGRWSEMSSAAQETIEKMEIILNQTQILEAAAIQEKAKKAEQTGKVDANKK